MGMGRADDYTSPDQRLSGLLGYSKLIQNNKLDVQD